MLIKKNIMHKNVLLVLKSEVKDTALLKNEEIQKIKHVHLEEGSELNLIF